MTAAVTPFSLKDAPALIERLLPVQKLSAEAYKEQMAKQGKTLTPLGSYWKGRKPLILAKACILGCLLPATDNPARDLEIFEKLMAMDDESFVVRWKRRPKPKEILATLSIARIADYFTVEPEGILPASAPVDWSKPEYDKVKVAWRADSPNWSAAVWKRRCCPRRLPRAGRPSPTARGSDGHRPRPHLGRGQRSPGHERPFVSGVGRAAWHHALRPPAARGRYLLRLRPDSLRSCSARLRRLCLRPQPGGVHAHLGCFQHRRRFPESREKLESDQQELVERSSGGDRSDSASRPTAKAGVQGISVLRGSSMSANAVDGAALPTLIVSTSGNASLPSWCRTPGASGTTSSSAPG